MYFLNLNLSKKIVLSGAGAGQMAGAGAGSR